MAGRPAVDREFFRTRIVEYLTGHAGHATQPELRHYLVTELRISDGLARKVTREIIHGPGFTIERQTHRPRTIHVRLAPPRKRRLNP